MQLKDVPLTVIRERADLLRGLMLVLIFRPAAFVFPERVIWGLAYVCAMFTVAQASGRRMVQDFRTAFGVSRRVALRMALRAHAIRLHEFAFLQKIILRSHRPFDTPSQLDASDEVRRIVEGDGSFVLALAHFERNDAAAAVFNPASFHDRPVHSVAFKLPNFMFLPHLWRIGLQLRQVLRATAAARTQRLEFVYTGGALTALIDKARAGRIVVTVNVDAHWSRGRSSSLTRPFAGAAQRTFSTGAAKLARLSGTPLLLGLPVLSADGRAVHMRLLGPFRSSAMTSDQQDVEATRQVLDAIEREVGERPCEYLLDIGGERRWNPQERRWDDAPLPAAVPSLTVDPG